MADYRKEAPSSPIPQSNREASLIQARMNIRILSLKHAMRLENARVTAAATQATIKAGWSRAIDADISIEEPNAVNVVAQASIIEEYLIAGLLIEATPATVQPLRKPN